MKKIFISLVVLLWFVSTTFASCMYEEIDPQCNIAGETYVNSCQGWSDTSSWSMPIAYVGTCKEVESLTETEKKKIFIVVDNFFKKKDFKGTLYGFEGNTVDDSSSNLNPDGQKFVDEKLFPLIKKLINKEYKKNTPNVKNIAILNYIASVVKYDYYISQ